MQTAPQPGKQSTIGIGLIVALFFAGRLMLLLAFPPENLITYGDYPYYFDLADLTQRGFYPFIDYWQEYPPIFPYLNILVYFVAGQQLKNHIVLLAFTFLLVECANLYLLYRLAFVIYNRSRALMTAWIYVALSIPTIIWLNNFDSLMTFFLLWGLYALIRRRHTALAVALGLGAMVKIMPLVLLAPVWRLRGWKMALLQGGAALVISLAILAPFWLVSPQMTTVSLLSQVQKSSYQTVWALLDGNTTTGSFGPLADHFDPEKAVTPLHNPAVIPSWLTLIPFGLLGLYILTQPRRLAGEGEDAVIFTTLTFIVFFLWTPGWSPQWQVWLIPLLLLALPVQRAVLFILVLGFVNLAEWPIIISRGMTALLPVTVLARTLIFVLLGWELFKRLKSEE